MTEEKKNENQDIYEEMIYLDNHATTPCDPRVVDEMVPYLSNLYGNAASRSHRFGWDAKEAVELSRERVANLIGATAKEIVFTSGATESNNLAIKGAAHYYQKNTGKTGHLITPKTEHKAVLDSCHSLEEEGWDITWLDVDTEGLISLEQLKSSIRPDTVVVSVMFANNEIGVIQPIGEIGTIVQNYRKENKESKIVFHCDAVQALGRVSIDVRTLGIDLLSISGHKMYGPKGIGALFVRKGRPRIRLASQIDGGGHERGMRSGTLPVHQIVGLGKAAELAQEDLERAADLRWRSCQLCQLEKTCA